MATPRSMKINLSVTPYYHCITRCVRRSYLCGKDALSGRNYDHRKKWLITRIKTLANIFAIRICAYAIMSNHYHLILFIDETQMLAWTDEEVKERWAALFPRDAKLLENNPASQMKDKIALWRSRLADISWFMRCLNENIARLSNQEDGVTGRFWEGRFISQALLDEGAILAAMVYVDLNPIRAKTATTPEDSEFTSIYERIQKIATELQHIEYDQKEIIEKCDELSQPKDLMPFSRSNSYDDCNPQIDFKLSDYIQLVDFTGRILREGKRGIIPNYLPPIFKRLRISEQGWFSIITNLEKDFCYAVGNSFIIANFGDPSKKRALKGINAARKIYLAAA